MIGFSGLPVDDRNERLHHATGNQGLPSGLIAGQVVEEGEERRGQGCWEGVGHRRDWGGEGGDARPHQHRQETVVRGGSRHVYDGIQSVDIEAWIRKEKLIKK